MPHGQLRPYSYGMCRYLRPDHATCIQSVVAAAAAAAAAAAIQKSSTETRALSHITRYDVGRYSLRVRHGRRDRLVGVED